MRAASTEKWLEVHGLEHWTHFYTDYGRLLQKRFFDHFLKGEDNGWDEQPPVLLQVRHPGERFVERTEQEWPLARTQWTKFYLDAAGEALTHRAARGEASVAYEPLTSEGDHVLDAAARAGHGDHRPGRGQALRSSSATDGRRPVPRPAGVRPGRRGGALPRHARPAHAGGPGLAARLAPQARPGADACRTGRTTPHDEVQPLVPGDRYDVDVEIWPTCVVVPAGLPRRAHRPRARTTTTAASRSTSAGSS